MKKTKHNLSFIDIPVRIIKSKLFLYNFLSLMGILTIIFLIFAFSLFSQSRTRICPGFDADIVIFDDNIQIQSSENAFRCTRNSLQYRVSIKDAVSSISWVTLVIIIGIPCARYFFDSGYGSV